MGVARFLVVVLVLTAFTASAQGQSSVTLAWDPSPGGAIAGYRLYEGGASRTYTNVIAAGNMTNATVSGLASGGTYFFAATAYDTSGLESDFSSEVSYTVPLPTNNLPTIALTFSNPSGITIPDSGAGTPYPSTINVSGMGGLINNVTLTLANLSHTWVSDVHVLLVGPAGQKILLFANVGDAFAASNVTVTLSDAAASALPSSGSFATGTYKPTSYALATAFPAPAPTGPYAATLSTLNGQSANGTWSLYVFDDGANDQGSFAGGWSLTVSTTGAAPTISAIPNQSTTVNTATPAIPFTVNDTDTPVASLTLSSGSSNPTLVPTNNIMFGGSGGDRTVTMSPAANQAGTATITVSVSDGTSSASDTFVLTVTNPPPTVALTSPTNGASYTAPATAELAASVTANGHSITTVQFYDGATLLGEVTSAPYSFIWSNVSAGSYSLSAQAVYDAGSTVASSPANVTVTNPPPTVALTSPTNGASYTAPATINLAASVTANGHSITTVQFYDGATLLGEVTSAPYSFIWSNVSAGSYSLSAQAIDDAGSTVASSLVNIAVTGLPTPWQTADIGSVGAAGSASGSNGLYIVTGAGNISGTADNFRFVYQPLSGDGEIKVRLNSVENTGTSGRAGVMIRESLTSSSEYAFMGISPDGTFRWQRRIKTGSWTWSSPSTIGIPPNVWMRLLRAGNALHGYMSTDGTNWTEVDSRNIIMATEIYVGLAVASGSSNTLNTATFTDMSVVP